MRHSASSRLASRNSPGATPTSSYPARPLTPADSPPAKERVDEGTTLRCCRRTVHTARLPTGGVDFDERRQHCGGQTRRCSEQQPNCPEARRITRAAAHAITVLAA